MAAPLLALSVLAAACTTVVSVTPPDPRFPASAEVGENGLPVREIVDLAPHRERLYVRRHSAQSFEQPFSGGLPQDLSTLRGRRATWIESEAEFEDYLVASLDHIGYFGEVRHLAADEVLPAAGNYLVADYLVDWNGAYDFVFHLRMVDPNDGRTLLHARHSHFRGWPRLDRPLFNPVLNAVIDWKDDCSEAFPRPGG